MARVAAFFAEQRPWAARQDPSRKGAKKRMGTLGIDNLVVVVVVVVVVVWLFFLKEQLLLEELTLANLFFVNFLRGNVCFRFTSNENCHFLSKKR